MTFFLLSKNDKLRKCYLFFFVENRFIYLILFFFVLFQLILIQTKYSKRCSEQTMDKRLISNRAVFLADTPSNLVKYYLLFTKIDPFFFSFNVHIPYKRTKWTFILLCVIEIFKNKRSFNYTAPRFIHSSVVNKLVVNLVAVGTRRSTYLFIIFSSVFRR